DYVDRRAQCRPHIVEVHPRGHHINQDLVGPDLGCGNPLDLERALGLTEALRTNQLRVHLSRHMPDRRNFTNLVDFLAAHSFLFPMPRRSCCGLTTTLPIST